MGRRLAMATVRIWQLAISPLYPPCCRFSPSCSTYMIQALGAFGVWRGGWLGLRRLCRCHPFHRSSGYDPVPERWPGWFASPAAGRPEAHLES